MKIVRPAGEHLPTFIAALEKGWSPDSTRGADAAKETLDNVLKDPPAFLARAVDREALGPPVKLPDGSLVQRLPGFTYWLWDGEFCGLINFRWQRGTAELPPHVLGHIGYGVVPWKRGKGYATEALKQLLPLASEEGLPYVELTCDPDNVASRKVIESNGGVFVENFTKPPQFGGKPGVRYRIHFREKA